MALLQLELFPDRLQVLLLEGYEDLAEDATSAYNRLVEILGEVDSSRIFVFLS